MKILILTGDGAEALEVMYPLQRCQEAGHEPIVAAPQKKHIGTVVHDFEPGFDTYTEKAGYRVEAAEDFSSVSPGDYGALIIPGGRAPEWIRNSRHCLEIVRAFFEAEKPVAAICHAAANIADPSKDTVFPT